MNGIFSYIINLYFRMSYLRQIVWIFLIFIIFSITFIIISQKSDISTKPVGWEKSFYISPFNINSRNVSTASKGRLIAVVFEGESDNKRGIFVSISFNDGEKFLSPNKIADIDSKIDVNPHIAISHEGMITIAWHTLVDANMSNRIFLSKSNDFGANWSLPEQVKIDYEMELLPRIHYDHKGDLHLFFHGFKGGAFNLYHAVSGDGKKFKITGSIIKLAENMKGAFFPAITLSRNFIYIVWQGKTADFTDDLFFMRSSNYGSNWSSPKRITTSKANDASPSIILHNDTLYVAYRNSDDKNWAIKLLRGMLYGEIWETKPLTISKTNADCFSPKIAEFNNELFIAWYDIREVNSNIFLRKYNIKDNTLSDEVKISLGKFPAKNPAFVSPDDKVGLLWEEASRIIAKYNDVYAATPVVFSKTHSEGIWSRNPVAVIEWTPPEDESGIVGYATIIGKSDVKDINPTILNIKADQRKKVIPELPDGVTYFHIRAIDGAGNYSRTIHYKIQVSANPMAIPVIVSSTHPQGKSEDIISPVFRWALDDTDRLKGFLYSLSKDTIKKPDKFITAFEITFDNLEPGKYFFALTAVDKTNMNSSLAVFPFIIGTSGVIDTEDLKRIAHKDVKIEDEKVIVPLKIPEVEILFPFDSAKPFNKGSFKAIIVPKNIPSNEIIGYSMDINRKKLDLSDRINLKSNVINIENIKDGEYFVSVKAKYRKLVNGAIVQSWTKPYSAGIQIKLPIEISPVEYYGKALVSKIGEKAGIVSLSLLGFAFSIIVLGFGGRLKFIYKLINYRVRIFFRLLLKS